MTTRLALHQLIRSRLGDTLAPHQFSDLQVNQWINDSIAEYSIHFPRRLSVDLSIPAGAISLPLTSLAGYQQALHLECPLGQIAPSFLTRRSRHSGTAFTRGGTYDIELLENVPVLHLGEAPGDACTARLAYAADHAYPQADADELSVPDRHLELLVLFVRLCVKQAQLAIEQASEEPGSYLIANLSFNVNKAEQEYRARLKDYQRAGGDGAEWVSWGGI
jgi:hypothetical protein